MEWWIQTLPLNILHFLLRPVGTLLILDRYDVIVTVRKRRECVRTEDVGLVQYMDICSKYLMVLMDPDDRWRSGTYIIV